MLSMLLNSFWLPIKNAKQVFIIFWPVFLVLALTISVVVLLAMYTVAWTKAALHFKIASLWSVYFYIFFLAISGVIKWHRLIILEEQAGRVPLVPSLIEIRYLARGMLLFLSCAVPAVIASLHSDPLFGKAASSTIEPILIFLIVLFLCVLLLRKFVLIFPAIAIHSEDSISSKALNTVTDSFPWAISIFIVLALFVSGSLLSFLKLSVITLRPEGFPEFIDAFQIITFAFVTSIISVFYGLLTFTTLLSLFYKEHIYTAQKNQAQ